MGMSQGRTICSKHDEIMKLAEEIQTLCSSDLNPSDISSTFQEILDKAEEIDSLAFYAKDDGQSMENGLNNKKEKLKELEQEKEELDSELRNLIGIEELYEEAQERVEELEEELEELKQTTE